MYTLTTSLDRMCNVNSTFSRSAVVVKDLTGSMQVHCCNPHFGSIQSPTRNDCSYTCKIELIHVWAVQNQFASYAL